jgi:hypothetical protein
MQVRIGEPVDPDSASSPRLRAQVMALRGDQLAEPVYELCAA